MTWVQLLLIDVARWLQRWGVYAGCCASACLMTAWYASLPDPGFSSPGALPRWVPTELVVYIIGLSVPTIAAGLTAMYQWLAAQNEQIAKAIYEALAEAMRRVDTRPAPTPDKVVPSPQPVPEPPGPVVFPRAQ